MRKKKDSPESKPSVSKTVATILQMPPSQFSDIATNIITTVLIGERYPAVYDEIMGVLNEMSEKITVPEAKQIMVRGLNKTRNAIYFCDEMMKKIGQKTKKKSRRSPKVKRKRKKEGMFRLEMSQGKVCPKCGCQVEDPFGWGMVIHDVNTCGGIKKR